MSSSPPPSTSLRVPPSVTTHVASLLKQGARLIPASHATKSDPEKLLALMSCPHPQAKAQAFALYCAVAQDKTNSLGVIPCNCIREILAFLSCNSSHPQSLNTAASAIMVMSDNSALRESIISDTCFPSLLRLLGIVVGKPLGLILRTILNLTTKNHITQLHSSGVYTNVASLLRSLKAAPEPSDSFTNASICLVVISKLQQEDLSVFASIKGLDVLMELLVIPGTLGTQAVTLMIQVTQTAEGRALFLSSGIHMKIATSLEVLEKSDTVFKVLRVLSNLTTEDSGRQQISECNNIIPCTLDMLAAFPPSDQVVLQAIKFLSKIVHNEQHFHLFKKHNGCGLLAPILDQVTDSLTQDCLAALLSNLAAYDDIHEDFFDTGCATYLIHLMSQSPKAATHAARGVANLTLVNDKYRVAMYNSGAHAAIQKLLLEGDDESRYQAVRSMTNLGLCYIQFNYTLQNRTHNKAVDLVSDNKVLPVLVSLFSSSDPKLRAITASAFSNLTFNDQTRSLVVQQVGLKPLLTALTAPDNETVVGVLRVVANLITDGTARTWLRDNPLELGPLLALESNNDLNVQTSMHFILGVKDIPVAGKCPETSSSESLQEPSSILSNNNVLPDSHPEQHQGADSLPPTQSNTSSQSLTPCNQMHTHNHQAPQPDTPSEETQHQTQVQLLETQVSSPSVETATEKGHCSDIHSQIQITETPTQSCQLSEHQILPPTQESVQTTETLTTPVNQPQIQQNQIPESQVQTDIEKAAETQPEIQIPEPIQTQVEVPAPTETQVEVPERESTPEVQHETQIPAPTQAQVEVPEPTQSQVEVPEPTQTQVEIPEPPSAQIPTPEIQESKELVETELQIQTCTEVPVLLVKTSETEVSTSQTVSGLHPLSNSQPLIESAVGTTEPIIDLQPKPSLSNDSLDQVNEEPASYTLAESPHLPKSEASLDGLSPYRKLLSPRYRSYEDDVDSSSDSEAENLKEEELRLAIEIARAAAADEELQAEIKKKKRAEKEEKRKQEEEELRVAEQKLLEEQLEAMQHSKEEEKAQLVENERMERERLDQQLAHAKAEEVKSAQDKMKQELEQLERQMEEKQKQIEQLRINAALQAKQQAIERKRKQEIRKKNKLIREQRRQEKEQELLEEAQNKILEEEARLKEALASRKAAKERRRQERMAKRKAAEEEKARLAAEELAREKEEQSKTEAMEQARILEEKAQKEAAEAAKISASNHRRQNIVTEIYTTEKTYIEALNRLIWDYERSMLAACGTTSAILTPEEITAIFSNLDTIVSYHTMLLEGITVRVKSWTDTALIGDLFISSATHLRCYVEYINNYDHCLATISELLKTNKKFKDFLQRVERTHLLSLTATLIYPVQRIPRYILLLTDLHRNTPSSHPDNQNILLAIQALKATGDYLNEKKREAESTAKLHEIQEAVYGRHKPDINVPGRLFVREGFVKLERSGKWRPAVLHLCDDLILFSKLKGKMKYHLKHVIPLDSVALLSQLAWQDLPKGSTPDLCLRVWEKSKNISVTFEASDAASKQGWFLAINAAADKRANKTERS